MKAGKLILHIALIAIIIVLGVLVYNSIVTPMRFEDECNRRRDLVAEKLKTIRSFKKNWNGNNAPSFPKRLMDKAENLINGLTIQPEIFPTALCTIQLEYDNARRDHMEIEIGLSDTAEIFIVKYNGEEIYETIPADADAINAKAGDFYG